VRIHSSSYWPPQLCGHATSNISVEVKDGMDSIRRRVAQSVALGYCFGTLQSHEILLFIPLIAEKWVKQAKKRLLDLKEFESHQGTVLALGQW